MERKYKISILGGTGDLGSGLAKRLITANYKILIGSRKIDTAKDAADSLGNSVQGMLNKDAAKHGDIVILTVPFSNQTTIIEECFHELQEKILIDTTVPLMPPKVGTVQLPSSHSAVVSGQEILGDQVRVVSAFQNISAELLNSEQPIDCDVLVCGNSKEAREIVIEIINDIGMKGWHGGQLANSTAAEALTSVLISINRHHKINHSGIKITGVDH